jgi:hypothetical protein
VRGHNGTRLPYDDEPVFIWKFLHGPRRMGMIQRSMSAACLYIGSLRNRLTGIAARRSYRPGKFMAESEVAGDCRRKRATRPVGIAAFHAQARHAHLFSASLQQQIHYLFAAQASPF